MSTETAGRLKFRTQIELGGKTATGFRVPAEVVQALGTTKKPPVKVTINGHTYRSTVAVYGGDYMLPLSAENRAAAGVAAGDTVEVELERDDQPREVSAPSDFSAALDQDQKARQAFDRLSYSHKRRYVLHIEEAKTPETRQRRIEKSVRSLHDGD